MTDEHLEKVIELLDAMSEMDPATRDEYLVVACAGDAELLAEVRRLLLRHEQAGDFLEQPALPDPRQPAFGLAGRQIGPYKLLRELGSGGMGIVYLAVRADDLYQKEVAVKLVWPGLQRAGIVRRFKQEQQILGRLDHPNIARLLDGGATEEGWPYVVMEYVDGVPITGYGDEQQLAIDDRLRLFRDVCAAVEYAHQNSVIHRDLKPSNLLVTKDGVVKLLDFGIAKLLKPDPHATAATLTQTGLHLLTPEYASPEQIRDEEITPRSDVYSLGVLLYELLTGVRPYHIKSPLLHEVSRVICEVEPEPPSRRIAQLARARQIFIPDAPDKLRRRLQGDLDNIVLTALAKDAARRYPSPAAFAADIERHLTGQAIVARGNNPLYRLSKRLHRHKAAVGLLLLMLFAVSGAMLRQWQTNRASQQAQRRTAYYETLQAANAARQRGRFDQVREILLAEPERAGFEWRYLWQSTQRQPLTLPHRAPLVGAEFWPDGKVLTSAGSGGSVAGVWDLGSGKLIAEYADTVPLIWWQVFGALRIKQVADELRFWDLRTGTQLGACPDVTGRILRISALSPQRGMLASYEDGTLKLWDRQSCQMRVLFKMAPEAYRDSDYSRDYRRLLTWAGENRRELWDMTTGRRIATLHAEFPYQLRGFSPDSRLVFLIAGARNVQLYDATTGRLLRTITDPNGSITYAAISADHRRLVTTHSNGEAKVWDTATGQLLADLRAGAASLAHLAFLDGDQRLVTIDTDGSFWLWDLRVYRLSYSAKAHAPGQSTVHAAPDGQSFVTTGAEGTAKVWRLADLLSDRLIHHHADRVFSVAFSPDGQTLAAASGDKTISLWDAATRRWQKVLTGHTGLVLCVSFARDGRRLISSGSDGTARVWDAQTERALLQLPHPQQVHFAAFSPDGKLVATACDDNNVRLWDARTGVLVATLAGHTHHVWTVGFAPDGRTLASGSNDETVKLWDVATRRELATLRGHVGWVWSTVFSPDGRYLATSGNDQTAILWDVPTRQQLRTFTGHSDEIFEVAFSPDGNRLATASNDNTIKIWETATGQELLTLKDHTDQVWSVAFSPDGNTLASGSWDKTVRLWRVAGKEEANTQSQHRSSPQPNQ